MNIEFLRKRFFILFFISVVLILLFFALVSLFLFDKTKEPDTTSGQDLREIKIVNIAPQNSSPLVPGTNQQFTIEFNKPVSINNIKFELKQKNFITDKTSITKLNGSIDGNILTITTLENILPLSIYTLSVFDINDNLLYRVQFESDDLKTISKKNNINLAAFLPYETKTFKLTYSSDRNIYYFNFKENFNSQEPIDIQFEKAKTEAISFIKNKGIDPSTLEIVWKYY